MKQLLRWCPALFFALTTFASGFSAVVFTATPATLFLLLGVGCVFLDRLDNDRPLISSKVLGVPVVIACLAYIICGAATIVVAADKGACFREIVQRIIIIAAPLYLFIMGPKRPRDVALALVVFLAPGALVALVATVLGERSGFRSPVYTLDMHKNQIGADCSTVALICAAFFIAGQYPRFRKLFLVLGALSCLGMLGAMSRAALLGTVLGVFLMLLVSRANLKYLVAFGVSLACGLVLLINTLPSETIEQAVTTKRFSSTQFRVDVWSYLSGELTKNPFMCIGWGTPIYTGKAAAIQDAASIFFQDWVQMGPAGLVAQISMILLAVRQAFLNAARLPRKSLLAAINCAALGIIATRFFGSYLDTFWVGRGQTLTAFAAIGMIVFVHLWLEQTSRTQAGGRLARGGIPGKRPCAASRTG